MHLSGLPWLDPTHSRELYARAVDQLGSATIDVRLGGIYALERVARDSPPDQRTAVQRTVVEVLSAFARVRSTDPALRPAPATPEGPEGTGGEPEPAAAPAGPVRPAVDVHAAVTVLARLPVIKDEKGEEVPRADLTGADLTDSAALHRLHVPPGGSLAHVDLTGADLTDARLAGANLADAWLPEANLSDTQLARADLSGARLSGANLTGADLLKADLSGARLERANLTGAWLIEAKLTRARLAGVNLTGAQLVGADLRGAMGLTREQLDSASGNAMTKLPNERFRPAHWPKPDDPEDA